MNGRIRFLLFVAAFAAIAPVLFGAGVAHAAGDKVIDVRVKGNQLLSDNAVLVHVRLEPGDEYDSGVVKADKDRLLRTGRFSSIVVQKTQAEDGVIVTFVVAERPLVAKLLFKGNKAFKTTELAKELTFGTHDPLNEFSVEAGRQAIRTKYRSKGFHQSQVTYDAAAFTQRSEVIYKIVEGPQVFIKKIAFEGNHYFSSWRLKQQTGLSQRLWPLVPGYLDIEQAENDVVQIRNLYITEGFLDAEVDRKLTFSADKTKATLTFLINEGPRYRISKLVFKGNTVFSDAELASRLKLQPQTYLTSLALRRDERTLVDTYGEVGYIEAFIATRKVYEEQPGLLELEFTITERDKYKVGEVIIRGNDITKENVLRRNLGIFPEQLYNTVAVEKSRQQLLDSRLFRTVTITPVGQTPGVRDAVVQVTEGETAQFSIGGGMGSNSGLQGNISLTEKNFDIMRWPRSWSDFTSGRAWRGAGQTFRIEAKPGVEIMEFNVQWFEPMIFDKPYSVGTKAFLFNRGRENYDETRYGGVFSFGHRFKNRWYGELATRIEGVDITDIDSTAPIEITADKGQHLLAGLKGTLIRDRTDSRWLPSTGDRFRINYEQVTGDYNFGKAEAQYRIYRTLYVDALDRKHVISGRASVGGIFGDAPVFERFYGGGMGSVRGFEYRGISPRGTGSSDAIGGDMMVLIGAEYEFPIVTKQVRGVLFLDTGTVEDNFGITAYRASIGAGIRWIVPMLGDVPMSFDFGFPISKDGQDDTQIFSFSVGVLF